MRWIAVAVAILLCGCGSSASDAWTGDERFTASQRLEIEAAMAWMVEYAGAAPVEIAWTSGGPCKRRLIVADLPAGTIGDSSPDGCVRIDTAQGADRVGVIAAHEVTHVRCGPYHHDGVGLMTRTVPPILLWTDDDHATTACAPE